MNHDDLTDDPFFGTEIPTYEYRNPIPAWMVMGSWIWLTLFAIIGWVSWGTAALLAIGVFLTGALLQAGMKQMALRQRREIDELMRNDR